MLRLPRTPPPAQPVQYKDYYATLGVPKTATADEVRKAFRKLARQHHPDMAKAKDKPAAEAKFKEINEAYEVLSDADKRQRYDHLGADWERGGAGGFGHSAGAGWPGGGRGAGADPFGGGGGASFGGTGFSDFFEQFFAGRAGRGAGRPGGATPGNPFGGIGGAPERGADVEADLLVTLEEALAGAKKKISFRRDGSSKVETYEVRIPTGVREGQRIRLAGQGEAGGDLYLRVRFAQHPDYRIEGGDLLHDLELSAPQAVLGTEATIPTPDGPRRLRIPPGTQPGRKFRLKGQGLPTSADARGDFYVVAEVTLPTELTPEAREHWDALARLGSAAP